MNDRLHAPGVSILVEAEQAEATGWNLVKVDGSPACLAEFRRALPELAFIATGDITLANIAAYAQAGAMGVAAGRTLIAEPYTSMAVVISTARALQWAWTQAQFCRDEE